MIPSDMMAHCDASIRIFVQISAAVLLMMCAHTVRASSLITDQHGERGNFLRRLNDPQNQHHTLQPGLMPKTGETETNLRNAASFINHPSSRPVQYVKGSFSYRQNSRNNGQPRVTITKLQNGEMLPASSIFTPNSLHRQQNFEQRPLGREAVRVPQRGPLGTSFSSQTMLKKPSQKEGEARTINPLKVDKGKTSWEFVSSSLLPSHTSQHWMPRQHHRDPKRTNEPTVVRTQSVTNENKPQQSDPNAVRLGGSRDAEVTKKNPSQELMPFRTNYLKMFNSDSGKTPQPKQFQSYLFKNSVSQLKESTGDGRGSSRGPNNAGVTTHQQSLPTEQNNQFIPNSKLFSKVNPDKQDLVVKPVSLIKHQLMNPSSHISAQSHSKTNLHPLFASRHQEKSVPLTRAHLWDNHASRRAKLSAVGRLNTTVGLMLNKITEKDTKETFYFKVQPNSRLDFEEKSTASSSSGTTNSQQSRLNKEMEYRNKIISNHMSQKYRFDQRRTSTTKEQMIPDSMDSFPNSPGVLNLTNLEPISTPELFVTNVKPVLSENNPSTFENTSQSSFRLYKGKFGLEEVGPLERARLNMTVPKSALEGFKLQKLQTWQSKFIRIHRKYNKTGEAVQDGKKVSTESRNIMSGNSFKPLVETERGSGTPSDEKHSKVHPSQGFWTIINKASAHNTTQWQSKTKNPDFQVVSSSFLQSTGHGKISARFNPRQRVYIKNQTARENGNGITSSTVRGKRVRQKSPLRKNGTANLIFGTKNSVIFRLPKPPTKVSPITYDDILGSASFSSVSAESQTPSTLTDGKYFTNKTLGEDDGLIFDVRNTSESPDAKVYHETKASKSVEEHDNQVQTDLFLHLEESGVRGLNLSDVLSTITVDQTVGKDSLELDYLRTATGNISFKSAQPSDDDQQ